MHLMRGMIAMLLLLATGGAPVRAEQPGPSEPNAGKWKTWLIASGAELRTAPPPDREAAERELAELEQTDRTALDRMYYWETGAPSYRWSEIAIAEHLKQGIGWPLASRNLALMHIAIYDAMVAAWDSKYTFNRPRPSMFKADFKAVVAPPPSPSYPAEHAVAAGAACEVLAYVFPDRATFFRDKPEEAARSRLIAGVNYLSDIAAGLVLGRQVAALVLARGKTDGTDAKWTGSVPSGPGKWRGTNPILPMAGTWKPWVLSSQSEFRPRPPIPYDSPAKAAELAELKNFPRTMQSNNEALFWEAAAGGLRAHQYWNVQLSKKSLEYRLDANPPRAARAFVLPFVTLYDAAIACSRLGGQAGHHHAEPPEVPRRPCVFVHRRHPRPREPRCIRGAESRIWAGIHYRSDVDAGRSLAIAVADKVIERAKRDGADESNGAKPARRLRPPSRWDAAGRMGGWLPMSTLLPALGPTVRAPGLSLPRWESRRPC